MSLDLTADAVNEFYDIIHSIDHSLDNIHGSLEAIVLVLGHVASQIENINNNLSNHNHMEV